MKKILFVASGVGSIYQDRGLADVVGSCQNILTKKSMTSE